MGVGDNLGCSLVVQVQLFRVQAVFRCQIQVQQKQKIQIEIDIRYIIIMMHGVAFSFQHLVLEIIGQAQVGRFRRTKHTGKNPSDIEYEFVAKYFVSPFTLFSFFFLFFFSLFSHAFLVKSQLSYFAYCLSVPCCLPRLRLRISFTFGATQAFTMHSR